jgi:glycerol-3-phosphate dehydrogenase
MANPVDILVIGGGVNGAGIARDAAGRGLSVHLVEKGDLAQATSSASSKLIHGGLRYLEYGEFRLVREALTEREVLLGIAPHIIEPLRFVLPYDGSMRSPWLLRLGLFLYDHLGGRKVLPGTETVKLRSHAYGQLLQPRLTGGFVYSDCSVQDSRLVVLNARDAALRGARISTRSKVRQLRRDNGIWQVSVEADGVIEEIAARVVVNAAGPWVADILVQAGIAGPVNKLRLVKGSHIVVPRLYDGPQAYILQNDDRRVIFVIPYEGQFSLIGTTDVPCTEVESADAITPDETAYLCRAVSRWFARAVQPSDVIWSYAGVRPLYDDEDVDASAASRDYMLKLDRDGAPILSVFGGKITTYRRLAEHAMELLQRFFPAMKPAWTGSVALPGGDLPNGDLGSFAGEIARKFPFLGGQAAWRLARSYGTDTFKMLKGVRDAGDLGHVYGMGFSMRELEWLIREEWARTADDVLWRRSKLGLHFSRDDKAAIAAQFEAQRAA